MPGIMLSEFYPENDSALNQSKTWRGYGDAADKERKERVAMIDKNWKYYYGDHEAPLKVRVDDAGNEIDHNVILNLYGQALDDLTAFIGVPRFEVEGGINENRDEFGVKQTTKSDEQQRLESTWESNELDESGAEIVLSGLVAGHVFVKLLPDSPDDDDDLPEAILLNPRLVTVFWDAGYTKRRILYRLEWMVGENERRRQDIVPDWMFSPDGSGGTPKARRPEYWVVIEYQSERGGGLWKEIDRETWDYPFPPVVDWKNSRNPHEYYGRPELRTRLNDHVNFNASNTQKIIYHYSHPITYSNANLEDVRNEPGQIIDDLGDDGFIKNVEMQSDLSASLSFFSAMMARFFSEARLVDLSGIKDKLGQLTNFGLRVLFSDQIDLAEDKRRRYGKGLERASRWLLWLASEKDPGKVEAKWPDLLPVNESELTTMLVQQKDAKFVDSGTAIEELGRDAEEIQRRIESDQFAETDAAVNRQTAIQQIGGVLAGNGVNLQ